MTELPPPTEAPRDAVPPRDRVEVAPLPPPVNEARVGGSVSAGRDGEHGGLPADAGSKRGAIPHGGPKGSAASTGRDLDDARVVNLDTARAVPDAASTRDRRAANFLRDHGFNFGEALRFGLLGARVAPASDAGSDEDAARVSSASKPFSTAHNGESTMEETSGTTSVADRENERRAAVAAWVRNFGTSSQRARLFEGLLPEEEAFASIRAALFEPTRGIGLRLFRFWQPGEVCVNDEREHGPVHFATQPCGGLTAEQFERFSGLRTATVNMADYELRIHFGACARGDCKRSAVTALVTFDFHGRPLSREFIL